MVYSVIRTAPAAEKQLTILVNTGFLDAVSMTGRAFEGNECPAVALVKAGFTPADFDIVVLNRGQLLAAGAPAVIRADPKVREIYLGSDHAAPEESHPI